MKAIKIAVISFSVLIINSATADGYKEIDLVPSYEHTLWGIKPVDLEFKFAAFTTSFDGPDDNNGNGKSDKWNIPEWVAYEIKGGQTKHPASKPSKWLTKKALHQNEVAPNNASYVYSGATKMPFEKNNTKRFSRGHLCMASIARRISSDAGYNTYTVLNAVPQLQWQNNGIWKKLENDTIKWADRFDRVWIITGPAFFNKDPAQWLGQEGEVKVAIPDRLYKIVIRKDGDKAKAIAFLIPNILQESEKNYWDFQTTIDEVERVTGLKFLTELSSQTTLTAEEQAALKSEALPKSKWAPNLLNQLNPF